MPKRTDDIRRELRGEIFREVTREIVLAANLPDPRVEQRRRGAVAAAIRYLAGEGKPYDAAAIAAVLEYDQAVVERALAQLEDLGWRAPA